MSRYPMSTSPQPKPANRHPHDRPLRMPSHHLRPDSPLAPSTVNGNSADMKGASPGSAIHLGWQFPRNRPRPPDFEPDTSSLERSPSSVHRPTSRIVGSGIPSHIPLRSGSGAKRLQSSKEAMVRRSQRATNAQRLKSRKPTVQCHQRFIYLPEFASKSESVKAPSL
jgi:hypothetical protein